MHPRSYRTLTAFAICVVAGGAAAAAARWLAGWGAHTSFLVGAIAATVAFVLHVVTGIFSERGRMIAWVTEQDRSLPELSERLLRMEQNVAGLISELTAEHSRRTADLAAELAVLRRMVERMAREGYADAGADGPAGPSETGGRDIAELLHSALRESRVDLYLQPIVRLPSRKVVHYEAFSRLRDENGRVFTPGDYLGRAAAEGLVTLLDNLLLIRSINLIRRLGPRRPGVRLFCNISAASLTDEAFLTELTEFLARQTELADRLVFEIGAADFVRLPEDKLAQLESLAGLGFDLSLDNVADLDALDAGRLARLNVRFLKMDAAAFLDSPTDRSRHLLLAETLERHGITLIVTRIETDRTAAEVVELGAPLGQGYLFGMPRPGRGVAAPPPDAAQDHAAPDA